MLEVHLQAVAVVNGLLEQVVGIHQVGQAAIGCHSLRSCGRSLGIMVSFGGRSCPKSHAEEADGAVAERNGDTVVDGVVVLLRAFHTIERRVRPIIITCFTFYCPQSVSGSGIEIGHFIACPGDDVRLLCGEYGLAFHRGRRGEVVSGAGRGQQDHEAQQGDWIFLAFFCHSCKSYSVTG